MKNREIAKIAYQEIMFVLSDLQQNHKGINFHIPHFIRIDNEAYFYDDLYREEIKAGYEVSESLK